MDMRDIDLKHRQPCMFKCYDFTTHIVGRWDLGEKAFYVERGDGTKYWYRFGIVWHKPLCAIDN